MTGLPWVYDDGGRALAGFRGEAGDCVTRAIAIATGASYMEVYDGLNDLAAVVEARSRRVRSNSRNGVWRRVYETYLRERGWFWTPVMQIGSGCTMHLSVSDFRLIGGPVIARLSKHVCAVLDGVVRDTQDPCRDGTRCVYGYFWKGS